MGEFEGRRKRGRPVKGIPKNNYIGFRGTEMTRNMVDELCEWSGKNISEVMTSIISKYYLDEKLKQDAALTDEDEYFEDFYDDFDEGYDE